jgi:hypothetical protein
MAPAIPLIFLHSYTVQHTYEETWIHKTPPFVLLNLVHTRLKCGHSNLTIVVWRLRMIYQPNAVASSVILVLGVGDVAKYQNPVISSRWCYLLTFGWNEPRHRGTARVWCLVCVNDSCHPEGVTWNVALWGSASFHGTSPVFGHSDSYWPRCGARTIPGEPAKYQCKNTRSFGSPWRLCAAV